MSSHDPLDQLSALRVEIDAETRANHLAAIGSELRRQRSTPSAASRRWRFGVVIAMLLAGPATAVASDGAAPGDLLYPLKLATEPIVRLVDRDVVAEHRVEEVAVLIDRRVDEALIDERIDIARDAVAGTDTPRLEAELDRLVDGWVADRAPISPPSTRETTPSTQPAEPSAREPEPVQTPGSSTTTDAVRDTPPPSDVGATTTTSVPVDRRPVDGLSRDTP